MEHDKDMARLDRQVPSQQNSLAVILTSDEFSEISQRIAERFPHDDNYDQELLSIVLCQECNGAIDDHKASCIVPEIHRLVASHRALVGDRDSWKELAKVIDEARDRLVEQIESLKLQQR